MKISLFKIPKTVSVFYCSLKNVLIFFSLNEKKIRFRSKIKVVFVKKNIILLTNILIKQDNPKNKFWFFYFNYITLILKFFFKKNLIKIKLNIIGIGFKFFVSSLNNNQIIQIKAGFSHKTFYKLPKNIKVLFLKPTSIILIGYCYKTILQIATNIKNLRLPDPYKKKGILYKNENIRIKQGKVC